jgi:hypothetical protein
MISLVASLVVVAVAVMILVSQRQTVTNMKILLRQAQEKTLLLEKKIDSSREELRKSKEELEREKGALRDARELNKKKLRRHATTEFDQQTLVDEATMTNKALDDNQKAILALEAQIEQLKKEHSHHEETIRAQLAGDWNTKEQEKNSEVEDLKKKITELQEEVKKQKRLMRPEGNKIDLKTLSDEAACEFARVYRKAEQHERLHGIARAKLHLAQEKFTELQKRYFSVCRELAVLAGNKSDLEPKEARDIAEKLVANHVTELKTENHENSKSANDTETA